MGGKIVAAGLNIARKEIMVRTRTGTSRHIFVAEMTKISSPRMTLSLAQLDIKS